MCEALKVMDDIPIDAIVIERLFCDTLSEGVDIGAEDKSKYEGKIDLKFELLKMYYKEPSGGKYVPRSILADLEPGSGCMELIRSGSHTNLSHSYPNNFTLGCQSGTETNWANSNYTAGTGAKYADFTVKIVNKELEEYDYLQEFQLGNILDEFPDGVIDYAAVQNQKIKFQKKTGKTGLAKDGKVRISKWMQTDIVSIEVPDEKSEPIPLLKELGAELLTILESVHEENNKLILFANMTKDKETRHYGIQKTIEYLKTSCDSIISKKKKRVRAIRLKLGYPERTNVFAEDVEDGELKDIWKFKGKLADLCDEVLEILKRYKERLLNIEKSGVFTKILCKYEKDPEFLKTSKKMEMSIHTCHLQKLWSPKLKTPLYVQLLVKDMDELIVTNCGDTLIRFQSQQRKLLKQKRIRKGRNKSEIDTYRDEQLPALLPLKSTPSSTIWPIPSL